MQLAGDCKVGNYEISRCFACLLNVFMSCTVLRPTSLDPEVAHRVFFADFQLISHVSDLLLLGFFLMYIYIYILGSLHVEVQYCELFCQPF